MFDWEMYLHLFEVYRFRNLVGLKLPIKHTLRSFCKIRKSNVQSKDSFDHAIRNDVLLDRKDSASC